MKSAKVREKFLEYFRGKDHQIVPSAPLVIKNDPTLMFTNAGMNQFKDLFLGNAPIKHPRIADTQKCLRVSGKHNDLEEVGIDTYHHTMFEMLGNWSFGDYFKKEAIKWAWELLTAVYQIDPDRLYATVFEGHTDDKLEFDQDAFDQWKNYLPADRILKGNKKDNFWEMGDTGPCGPCSEIHVDLRPDQERKKKDARELVNTGHPQVIEVWNLVFMEFNRKADGSLEKLPARHVDTGMGFERLCMALQGKTSTYDTDVFKPLIEKVEDISGLRYRPENPSKKDEVINIGMRVIVDHIRAISFAIADGQLPSNTGAGYVIRRILRRAIRYGYQSLGIKEPFLHRLVSVLASEMGTFFPEIESQKSFVQKVIKEEETSFFRTLEKGLQRIDSLCIELVNKKKKVLDGGAVFELYDTFGFPVDLTSLIARQYGLDVDEKGFEEKMLEQKTRSKVDAKTEKSDWIEVSDGENSEFIGYDQEETDARLTKYRKIKSKDKELYQMVFDRTPFYAESGGQVGDTGTMSTSEEKIAVIDTKKESGLIVHFSTSLPKNPAQPIHLKIDNNKRRRIRSNHSATHLLHAALRQVLGKHVEQKGSLVNDKYLRFDFSHFAKVSQEELKKIEDIVNHKIRENVTGVTKMMALEDAKKTGAMALFGEKYGDQVRVVTFDPAYSIELCGGTHVKSTALIGSFRITSESAVAAGIRRIEAVTGEAADQIAADASKQIEDLNALLKNPKDLVKSVEQLLEENSELRKKIDTLVREKAQSSKNELLRKIRNEKGINLIAETIALDSSDAIKDIAFQLKAETENLFLVLGAEVNGKPLLTVMLSDNLVKDKKMHAGNIVKELAKEIKGGGGGQPFYATAGGSDASGLQRAIKAAEAHIPN